MDETRQKEAVDTILRKAGLVRPPARHRALLAVLRRGAMALIGALVFSTIFVWTAIALTTWQAIVALFEAGFDVDSALALLFVSTRDNMTVAGIGLLGMIVGALVGLLTDL